MFLKTVRWVLTLLIPFIFLACGGDKDNYFITQTGTLNDSKVGGVSYSCGSNSGLTTQNGEFSCRSDSDKIEFSIGSIILGSIKTVNLKEFRLYPADLVGVDRNDTNNSKVVNILQILQSLDSDKNPNNGIVITEATREALAKVTTLHLDSNSTTQADLNATVAEVGRELIKADYAIAHYEDSLRYEINSTVDTVPPAPAIGVDIPIITNKDATPITINGERKARVFVNGNYINTTVDDNNSVTFDLNTTGDDGNINFIITLLDNLDQESDELNITILKDTIAPEKATVSSYEDTTDRNSVPVTIYGEENTKLLINDIEIGVMTNGVLQVDLNTSGVSGNKEFNIILVDLAGNRSIPLIVSIIKENPVGSSSVTGVVQEVGTNIKLRNVRVILRSEGQDIMETRTNSNGEYTFDGLFSGVVYSIYYENEGHNPILYNNITVEEDQHEYLEVIEINQVNGVASGRVSGTITNALNGIGIANATLTIREGQNNINGTIYQTIQTSSSGEYSTTLPPNTYTAEVIKDGYINSYFTIRVISGESNSNQNFSVSPIVTDGDMRIVLTWGANPSDLDSHLVRKTNEVLDYHVYFEYPYGIDANLDHDDVTSYGPETTTINNPKADSVYTYFVHHYAGYGSLKNSGAKVILSFNGIQRTFNVPNEDGLYWKVFEIVNGSIIPCSSNCVQGSINSNILRKPTDDFSNLFRNLPKKYSEE